MIFLSFYCLRGDETSTRNCVVSSGMPINKYLRLFLFLLLFLLLFFCFQQCLQVGDTGLDARRLIAAEPGGFFSQL